jgi:hypothetical protein
VCVSELRREQILSKSNELRHWLETVRLASETGPFESKAVDAAPGLFGKLASNQRSCEAYLGSGFRIVP